MPKKIKSLNDVPAIDAYLKRIGAEARSLRTAVVKEMQGKYWKDVATISFSPTGEVRAPEHLAPDDTETAAITKAMEEYSWPMLQKLPHLTTKLPKEIKSADPRNVFEFRDLSGDIIMLQLRTEDEDGERHYYPFTYWDDGEWRRMEPDGQLPLWGLDGLGDNTTVFIHEGAKAARAMREMVEAKLLPEKEKLAAHPWGEELTHAAHLGWIGGALSPYRTDWSALKKAGVRRAYIVSDNDEAGHNAVPAIARQLRFSAFHVQFTSEWPASFDLADPFPDRMFDKIGGKRYYNGPPFRACLHPATWATDEKPNKKGRPTVVLREHFKNMWAYVEEADLFVCTEMPEILRPEQIANKMLAPFSHSSTTCALIVKAYTGRSAKLCYRPDIKGRIVTDRGTSAINLHIPTMVKSVPGDPQPFLDFMAYMFPKEKERHEVLRWCATLIARPDVRMEYALLLVSEHQGIGKTTLGSKILTPLVGHNNVGHPNESDIVNSDFNGWLANKRLVVVSEIYSGHSWKAYNRLKSYITDKDITVNEKFQREYSVDNWCHFFACSNSTRALRVEDDDRRWFYPEVVEASWGKKRFGELYSWIKSGGLSIIKNWAENFGDYVIAGERAPMTDRKLELIRESRSDAQREVADLTRALVEAKTPTALAMRLVMNWVKASCNGARIFDSEIDLRKTMRELGAVEYRQLMRIEGRQQTIILNPVLWERIASSNMDDQERAIREFIKTPNDILGSTM